MHNNYKNKRINKPYLPDLIRPKEIRTVLKALGLEWQEQQVNQRGWVRIKSPLRDDRNPSFSFSVNHGGFKDFGTNEKGDIVHLVTHIKGFNYKNAEKWILKTANLNLIRY